MKVWERIAAHAADDLALETRLDVESWMYSTRTTPCDIEDEFRIIGRKRQNKLCAEMRVDCRQCLEKYLELEEEKRL